jgi:hypothetical protein
MAAWIGDLPIDLAGGLFGIAERRFAGERTPVADHFIQ